MPVGQCITRIQQAKCYGVPLDQPVAAIHRPKEGRMTRSKSQTICSAVSLKTRQSMTPVAEGIGIGRDETRFTGKIRSVTVEVRDVT